MNLSVYLQNTPILALSFQMTFSAEDLNIKAIALQGMAGS